MGLKAALFDAIINEAEDPDVSLPDWLLGNTPLGIERPIPCHGIFPPADDRKRRAGEDGWDYAVREFVNYESFESNADKAAEELRIERDQGFLEWFTSIEALEAEVGTATVSRMAAIIKFKNAI